MKTKTTAERRCRFTATERNRLIQEHAASGLTKKAFCARRRINLATFYAWKPRPQTAAATPAATFAQVEVCASSHAESPAAVEVLLPNGARIGIRHQGKAQELIELIRGVAGYGEAHPC
ncbi:MAG: IS66 family insertion sequence element accessory protein TnpA [Kiritimatiellia bacterium]